MCFKIGLSILRDKKLVPKKCRFMEGLKGHISLFLKGKQQSRHMQSPKLDSSAKLPDFF